MEMTPVKSSNVVSVGFDPTTKTLAVTFKNGGTYHYSGVDEDKHAALMKASSIGSYIHANIKGKHSHAKADL